MAYAAEATSWGRLECGELAPLWVAETWLGEWNKEFFRYAVRRVVRNKAAPGRRTPYQYSFKLMLTG